MLFLSIISTLILVSFSEAHLQLHQVYVNGKAVSGKETGIRVPPTNGPVKVLSSQDVMCNVNGDKPAAQWINVKNKDIATLQYWHDIKNDDIIAKSHASAMVVYMSRANDKSQPTTFYKIYEDNFNDGKWATDRLIAAKGFLNIEIPKDLAPGRYVMRTELAALHEAEVEHSTIQPRGVQLYISCAQFEVSGTGIVNLGTDEISGQAVFFPARGKQDMTGYIWNMYSGDQTKYPIHGPPIMKQIAARASYGKLQ